MLRLASPTSHSKWQSGRTAIISWESRLIDSVYIAFAPQPTPLGHLSAKQQPTTNMGVDNPRFTSILYRVVVVTNQGKAVESATFHTVNPEEQFSYSCD
ncbi:MAG: hypothetical protein R2795_11705 [Saprospiraceae bacterium]